MGWQLWISVPIGAFVVWWIYAFLNDSEGRLYRWTDGKYGKTPVEVQKALDAKAAEKKAVEDKGNSLLGRDRARRPDHRGRPPRPAAARARAVASPRAPNAEPKLNIAK